MADEARASSEETGSNASGSEQSDPGFLTGRWFKSNRGSQKKMDTKRCFFSFVFMLKVRAIATEVNSRVAKSLRRENIARYGLFCRADSMIK